MPNYRSDIKTFDYNNVRLLPQTGVLQSRGDADTSITFGKKTFKLPVIPANMSTLVDANLAVYLAEKGYFYVMHRFGIDPVKFTQSMHDKGLYSSISVGIQSNDISNIQKMSKSGINPEYITIDVAHGDTSGMFHIIELIRNYLPKTFVIAGNVGTTDGALRLAKAGVDAVKVGIGPGLSCLSSPNTGFGTRDWQLSAVYSIVESLKEKYPNVKIIADGGIREYGDIAKSIAFGADMVMMGGFLAGHDENPGELITIDNKKYKVMFGSASEHQKGEKRYVEGKKVEVPYKGPISESLQTIKENLQSSISYAGGKELMDLRDVDYVLV